MRPNVIQEYLRMADAKGFEATCEGLLHYKRTGEFMELVEETNEEVVVTVQEEKLNDNIVSVIDQIRIIEAQGFTTDQAIEILKLSFMK